MDYGRRELLPSGCWRSCDLCCGRAALVPTGGGPGVEADRMRVECPQPGQGICEGGGQKETGPRLPLEPVVRPVVPRSECRPGSLGRVCDCVWLSHLQEGNCRHSVAGAQGCCSSAQIPRDGPGTTIQGGSEAGVGHPRIVAGMASGGEDSRLEGQAGHGRRGGAGRVSQTTGSHSRRGGEQGRKQRREGS